MFSLLTLNAVDVSKRYWKTFSVRRCPHACWNAFSFVFVTPRMWTPL